MEISRIKSKSYKDLEVWQLAIDLVKDIYQLTKTFPITEIYGLTLQLRKSAISIASNIAEGQGRSYAKEFRQFLFIAIGSLGELETQLIIAKKIDYISEDNLTILSEKIDRIRKMIRSLAGKLNC
jgi:four helix bundle protein